MLRLLRTNPRVRRNSGINVNKFDLEPDVTYAFILASGEQVRSMAGYAYSTGAGASVKAKAINRPVYVDGHSVMIEGRDKPETWTEAWRTGLKDWTSNPDDLIGAHVKFGPGVAPYLLEFKLRQYDPKQVRWMSLAQLKDLVKDNEAHDVIYLTRQMSGWKRLDEA